MAQDTQEQRTRRARRRALRAAQVVTLGLAIAGGGCYARHEDGAEKPVVQARAPVDHGWIGGDAGAPVDASAADAAAADAALADAGECPRDGGWSACCDAHDWDPRWGCLAWGPYVPPAEDALPPSRTPSSARWS